MRTGRANGRTASLGTCWLLVLALVAAACGRTETGIETKPAAEILRESIDALRLARSFHVRASLVDSGGSFSYRFSISRRGAIGTVEQTIKGRSGRYEVIVIGERQYVKGPFFWDVVLDDPATASTVGDRWGELRDPARALPPYFRSPLRWANCVLDSSYRRAPLHRGEATKLRGRRAIVIIDPGGRPGSIPSRLAIAADGPPYPLSEEQTGPPSQGGGLLSPACGGGVAGASDASIRDARSEYSAYNADFAVEMPGDVVDVAALLQQRQA